MRLHSQPGEQVSVNRARPRFQDVVEVGESSSGSTAHRTDEATRNFRQEQARSRTRGSRSACLGWRVSAGTARPWRRPGWAVRASSRSSSLSTAAPATAGFTSRKILVKRFDPERRAKPRSALGEIRRTELGNRRTRWRNAPRPSGIIFQPGTCLAGNPGVASWFGLMFVPEDGGNIRSSGTGHRRTDNIIRRSGPIADLYAAYVGRASVPAGDVARVARMRRGKSDGATNRAVDKTAVLSRGVDRHAAAPGGWAGTPAGAQRPDDSKLRDRFVGPAVLGVELRLLLGLIEQASCTSGVGLSGGFDDCDRRCLAMIWMLRPEVRPTGNCRDPRRRWNSNQRSGRF